MKNMWEFTERLSDEELEKKSNVLAKNYAGGTYKHKNGTLYKIIDVTTININGTAYWGFIYAKELGGSIYHTRTIHEFLDGRFTLQ